MSLAVLADHMASKGRGPDSMLIHMSPREVQGLQALAMKHGGSLTINPETGLPEAGFLDKLLPTIIGAGISFFSGGAIDPMTAAAIVGGVQTVRTGDIGAGIQAGLGAYGGASLTAGVSNMGAQASAGEALAGTAAEQAAFDGLTAGAGTPLTAAQYGATASAADLNAAREAMGNSGTFSRGFDAATSKGGMQALNAATKGAGGIGATTALGMAAGPAILAELGAKKNMPQTVTRPGMITPYSFDPYSGTYHAATPYRAAEGGLMGMNNGGYGPGQLDFTQRSEPVVRMAEGGDVQRFAIGDLVKADIDKAYAAGDYAKVNELAQANKITAADVADTYKGFDTSGLAGLGINLFTPPAAQAAPVAQAQTANAVAAAPAYNQYTTAQMGDYLTKNPNVDLATAIKTTNADPNAVNAYIASLANPFKGSTETTGGSGTLGIYNQMLAQGIDPNELYNAANAAATANKSTYGGWSAADIAKGYNLDKGAYALSKQLNGVVSDKDWVKFMDDNKYSINDAAQAFGLSQKEVRDRYNAVKAAETKVVTKDTITGGTGNDVITKSGYHVDDSGALVPNISSTQNTSTNVTTPTGINVADASALPVGVSGAGITTINPNGTITTRPDLSLEMQDVRDDYVRGGGNLGYTSPTFASLKAVEDKYPLKGGSKQSYDYLTGKTPYSPTPSTPTGEIMKPYAESVLGIPTVSSKKMYLFDPTTKQYKINPDYAIPTRDPKTGKNTTSLTNKDVAEFVGKAPTYDALYTWMTTNNLSPEQVATASGKPFTEINKQFLKAQGLAGDDGKIDQTKLDEKTAEDEKTNFDYTAYLKANPDVQAELDAGKANFGDKSDLAAAAWEHYQRYGKAGGRAYTKKAKAGGLMALAGGGMAEQFNLGGYSDGGRLLRGPGDGVSDSIPATIGNKRPARLADGEFVVPARIVSELGNGSTEAGARKLYAMMDRVQAARRGSIGKGKVAKNSRADKYLPA